ncbi:MAG: S-layer homology domain-containing protein, partial [Clostridiales bacterium]
YAKATGIQSTGSADLSKFTDAAKISPWAKDGLTWAVANGVILGNGNNGLDPQASVSRGSVAAVLERLVKLAVQVQ